MQHPPLETIVEPLLEQSRCGQSNQALCSQIVSQVTRGKPVTPAALGASLQIQQDELKQQLTQMPDVEYDQAGNVVGWGLTLAPTPHQVQIRGKPLFTWCAFDTVQFPPALQVHMQVQSTCPVTGEPIRFTVIPKGVIKDLTPAAAVMSLVVPEQGGRSDGASARTNFCEQSLFFQSEGAASDFLSTHPETVILSLEEAARLGWMTAEQRFTQTHVT
jgi:alkylmercury lyase